MTESTEPEITDPREMRKRLTEIAYGRSVSWADHQRGFSSMGAVVRAANTMAEVQGLSGEDRYTIMAWHLLKTAHSMEKMLLNQLSTSPSPLIFKAHQ